MTIKRLIIAAVIFGIALLAGLSVGIKSPFAVDNIVMGVGDRVVLHGNVHPQARPEFDVGPTDPSLPMDRIILLLKLAPEKQAELDRLVAQQQDRSSPNFHRWLTPEEFGERFGRSRAEIARVSGWLVSEGFTIEETAKAGKWINFSGTVADVERAFHVSMHNYNVKGVLRHANSTDPSIPREFADLVAGPVSLHDFPRKAMHTPPHPISEEKLQPNYTDPSTGNYYLAPGDFGVIYDVNNAYSLGYDGTGVTIAIVGRVHPHTGNWSKFRSTFGLPNKPPHVIVNGKDPGDLGIGDGMESDLDVEWAGAVAKGATIDFVTSGSVFDTYGNLVTDGIDLSSQYIVGHNLAPIMSVGYGSCESDMTSNEQSFYNGLWELAASYGITVFVASGDSGVLGCSDGSVGVNGLASTPYNIAVGGTSLSTDPGYWSSSNSKYGVSALGYMPEVAWNDSSYGGGASGGGMSTLYSKPAWQACLGVPADGYRDVPDVSLNATPYVGYLVYTCDDAEGGPCASDSYGFYSIGGTSAGAPSFAGIMALIVQATQGQRQGIGANGLMYQLGNAQYGGAPGASAVFHDITSGDNSYYDYYGNYFTGYSCNIGYDLVTGLGTPDTTELLLAFQELEVLDVTAFSIEGGATSTESRTVTLNATLDSPITGKAIYSYMASESSTFSGAKWLPYDPSSDPTFTLSAKNGTKTVYFKVINGARVSKAVHNTITLAQPPVVSSFKVNAGAASTVNPLVKLNNTATLSPTEFMASEADNFSGAVWQHYSTAPTFTLSPGGGTKTVYFKARNTTVGVYSESAVANDTIQLIVPPTLISFTINGEATPPPTTNRAVTLGSTTTDGTPASYMASESSTFSGASWKTYSPTVLFTLSATPGLKTVHFKVKNAAGASTPLSNTITLQPSP